MAENEERSQPVDPVAETIKLYSKFVELAQLGRITTQPDPASEFELRRGWDHPLGLALSSKR